jgi:hypothetical protein
MESVVPPERRRCERCGRVECWSDRVETWVAAECEGARQQGDPHCVHEWDITGTYNPIDDE